MINIGKKKHVVTEKSEKAECVCPMMDYIAKMTAIDFDESGEFEYDAPHTIERFLLC